ncbi:MAG: hypothetical protein A3F10_05840 [Coxiella sp. RIFCSPHIGHO2_12_FULL_42_15]|nr:MAG: hypothetical protein A3F10_05840 [Coxiella sp. RIFCSPHIGHO2_12_FULL_42_15]
MIINDENKTILIKLLIQHEGLRLKPYRDTMGKLTIGVGRNLDDVGISYDEALQLLDNDINNVIQQLNTLPTFAKLNSARQMALANMTFNLGFHGILKFKNLWAALETGNYVEAAKEVLNSKWAGQVGHRAHELAHGAMNDLHAARNTFATAHGTH